MWRTHNPLGFRVVGADDFDSSPLPRALVTVVAGKIAGLVLLIDPAGADEFHLLKSVFSQGTALILAALLGLTLFRFGRAVVPASRLHLFVLGFVAANLLSALTAENTYVAVFGEPGRYLGLAFVADMLVLYWAVAVSFRRAADFATLALSIAIAGLLSVVYLFAQRLGLDPAHSGAGRQGAFGTFGDPDTLGQFLAIVFGGALGIAAFPPTSRPFVARVAAACVTFVALATSVAFATRGSLLALGAALAAAPLIALRLRNIDRATADAYLVRGLVAITLVTGIVTVSPLAPRIHAAVSAIAVPDRALVYDSALAAVAGRPVFGHGPDNFAVAYPRYRQAGSASILGAGVPASAGGWPFELAATLGLEGLLVFALLLFVAARSKGQPPADAGTPAPRMDALPAWR